VPLLAAVCLAAAATPARADWVVSPFAGMVFDGTTTFLDLENGFGETKITFGASGGWLSDGLLGVEGNLGYTLGAFDSGSVSANEDIVQSSRAIVLTGDVLVLAPKTVTGDSLRPYVLGGVGVLHISVRDVADAFAHDSSLLGLAVGVGAIGRVTDRSSLRFEVRRISNLTTDQGSLTRDLTTGPADLSFWRASVGVTIAY